MRKIRNEDILEALQRAAQAYGIKSLAPMLDKQPSTLYGELNPWGEPGKAKLGLLDAFEIMRITGDFTALELLAADSGFRLVCKSPDPDRETVAEEICQDTEKLGEWANVCGNPTSTEAQVRKARQNLAREVDQTEALKLKEIRERKAI